ncbi:MAG: ABC transporter ATP-binding protein [Granulosicoccus sp.]
MTTTATKPDSDEITDPAESILHAQGLQWLIADKAIVSAVSLQLRKGEIVGLLGLNGAGKSTTLKLLCGMLAPDSGSVVVNGYDMADSPLQARAQIGFLPDQPPIYNDMRVSEYLTLCAQIRGLKGNTLHNSMRKVIERCSLGEVRRKIIAGLSKGYRQRLGLAQAIIHEPPVIILDEPGNGLDPQQQENMHTLIRELGQRHAIVFSTHILSEAKSTCTRVALMQNGSLISDSLSPNDNLTALFHQDNDG